MFDIILFYCLSFRMDIYETKGKALLFFKRRALGKGRKVYVCDKRMRFAKLRHSAPKRTSGCRASGRHKSIPIPRISFCRHLRARSDTPLYSYNVCAEKFKDKRRRNIPPQNELFGKQEPDGNARVSLPAFRAVISTRVGEAPNKSAGFLKKCGYASEKRQKRFLFATLSPSLRP